MSTPQEAVVAAETVLTTATEALTVAGAGSAEDLKSAQITVSEAEKSLQTAKDAIPTPDPVADPIKADINELLAKARKDEKDKMYGKVEKLSEENKGYSEKVKSLEEQVATLVSLSKKEEPNEEPKEKNKSSLDTDAIQKMLDEQVSKLENDVFKPALDKLSKENASLKAENDAAKLDSHRKQLIADNKDTIIEELIIGKTSEELDTSLVVAKQAFAKYNIRASEAATIAANDGKLPLTPNINNGDPSNTTSEVAGMSPAEYAKNRTKLLAEAAQNVKARI